MEKVYVTNSEFDRSGNDFVTNLFAGLIGIPALFFGMVFLASGCEAIGL
jgi:hypothetical protein